MQEERKSSMGSAIVDVFDAGVALAKAEINALVRKVTELAKAKGLGVGLLLVALVPLSMALIFLVLAGYFGLVAAGLPWWGASLVMFVLGLILAGIIAFIGVKKLQEEIEEVRPPLTEEERLEAQYLTQQRRARASAPSSAAVVTTGIPTTVGAAPAKVVTPATEPKVVTVTDKKDGPA